jgi:hypothetical protein
MLGSSDSVARSRATGLPTLGDEDVLAARSDLFDEFGQTCLGLEDAYVNGRLNNLVRQRVCSPCRLAHFSFNEPEIVVVTLPPLPSS